MRTVEHAPWDDTKCTKRKAPEGAFRHAWTWSGCLATVAVGIARDRTLDAMPCRARRALGFIPREA